MAKGKLLALSNAVAGREDEFNTWYDQQHLPDLLRVPGVVAAQRYKGVVGKWSYLAVYELDGDPKTILGEIGKRAGTPAMPLTDAMDRETMHTCVFTPIGEKQTA
jgi:hypothetical protein